MTSSQVARRRGAGWSRRLSTADRRRLRMLYGSLSSRNRPGVVLMLHIGRCGSTVLANMLHQNHRVHWDGKIYRLAQSIYGKELSGFDYRLWTPRQFRISGAKYYGFEFKFLPDQYCRDIHTDPGEFLAACDAMGVTHYILLRRDNTLRQVVSYYSSKARGAWHLAPGGALESVRFRLDVDRVSTGASAGRPLAEYIDHVDDAYRVTAESLAGKRLLGLSYEKDIEDGGPLQAYAKVCDFLEVPAQAVDVRDKKINPPRLSELVDNLPEVQDALRGTPHEWMAREPM